LQFGAERWSLRNGSTYGIRTWWSVMQLGRERARGNSIGWWVLRLTSSCTHSFYLFKFEQVVI